MKIIRKLKLLIVISTLFAVASCAVNGINKEDIKTLSNAEGKIEKPEISNKHIYRLDYMFANDFFVYVTFLIKSSSQYIQMLVKNDNIISVSKIGRYEAFSPEIKRCTLFPTHKDLDVKRCLMNFTDKVVSLKDPSWAQDALKVDGSEEKSLDSDKQEAMVATTILSPLVIPALIVVSPLIVGDAISENETRENFKLKLGKNNNLQSVLSSIPKNNKSYYNDSGSFYFSTGVLLSTPAVGIGFEGDSVLWVQRSPAWVCGGGYMFWGNKCAFGRHDDNHF